MKYADLHTHSIFSDGRHDIPTLLQMAEREGLSFFSVTDHNNVNAYGEIKKHRALFSGEIIPAIELSAVFNEETIEVLGYGIDTDKMALMLKDIFPTVTSEEIIKHDVLTLIDHGVIMDGDFIKIMLESPWDIMEKDRDIPRVFWIKEMRRHPENARFFKSDAEFMNIAEGPFARQYLYNPSSPLFISQSYLNMEYDKIADKIHECGGLAFLAHPFIHSKNVTENLDKFKGLDGMECHYGTFTKEQKQFMCDFCDSHNLYKCGGSDFHGLAMRPQNPFARSANEKINFSLVSDWIDKVKTI